MTPQRDNVVPFPRTRMLKAKLRLAEYPDPRIQFAREVERRFHEIEQTMAGDRPSDTEPNGVA